MSDIRIFKFKNGEEVVATLEKSFEEGFKVFKPMGVQLVPSHNGSMGLMLIPWIIGNQKVSVIIDKSSLSIQEPIIPDIEFEKQYIQQTSSIAIAGKGKIQI